MDHRPSTPNNSDEIDLRELFCTLWASKVTITLITLACTVIAAGYAFLATPIYQASAQTLPPTSSGLAAYNLGSQLTGNSIRGIVDSATSVGIDKLSVETAYKAFLQRLDSNTIKLQFFKELYLPAHKETTNERQRELLLKRLDAALTISLPSKAGEYAATVSFEGADPKVIAVWANTYIVLAINATRQDLLGDLASEVALRKQAVSDQINTLRKVAQVTRDDRIQRVENALTMAESIGLQAPQTGGPLISVNNSSNNNNSTLLDSSMMYLRGAKALRAELNLLNTHPRNDAYIAELPDLLKAQALLESISINPEKLSVAIVDRVATTPAAPISPNKRLFVVLGFILGGILGIMVALIRKIFRA